MGPAPVLQSSLQKKKLSYKEQRELETLPERIAALEDEQRSLQAQLADGSIYTSDPALAADLSRRNDAIDTELLDALERWELLGSTA